MSWIRREYLLEQGWVQSGVWWLPPSGFPDPAETTDEQAEGVGDGE